jgi:hypothetical protein
MTCLGRYCACDYGAEARRLLSTFTGFEWEVRGTPHGAPYRDVWEEVYAGLRECGAETEQELAAKHRREDEAALGSALFRHMEEALKAGREKADKKHQPGT